jgi:hypothetical protein
MVLYLTYSSLRRGSGQAVGKALAFNNALKVLEDHLVRLICEILLFGKAGVFACTSNHHLETGAVENETPLSQASCVVCLKTLPVGTQVFLAGRMTGMAATTVVLRRKVRPMRRRWWTMALRRRRVKKRLSLRLRLWFWLWL